MYLKKLELKGFKSFADNTEILFNPGINVIVGPNGCGKSNLVDAIRWVLGEANVRHLRGQKGEDVIFSGTDKTRGLGMASVEMTMDNSTNILPVDYSEVMVARKIFRSGESEFTLNKSRVRMKDIGNLFMGTGLGKRGYSIISQGELEQVLNGQPLDRRLILEEASGVIKYRQQRDEVNKRIIETGQDLLRVADILGELNQQQEDLHIKAVKAQQYIECSTKLNDTQKVLLEFEINKLQQDYAQKNKALIAYRQELLEVEEAEAENIEKLTMTEERLEAIRLELNHLKEEMFALDNKKNSLEGEIRLSQERIKNNLARIATANLDENKYEGLLANIYKEVAAREQDYLQEKTVLESKQAEADEHYLSLNNLRLEIDVLTKNFEAQKAYIYSHAEKEASLKNTITEKEEEVGRIKERRNRQSFKKDELTANINQSRIRYSSFEKEVRILEAAINEINGELEQLVTNKGAAEHSLKDVLLEIEQHEKQLRVINNSLMSLKDNEEKMVGYSAAVKTVLKSKNELPGIRGLVGEILQVPEGLEVAMETAIGRGLENIIVDNAKSAQTIINFLKNERAGRATLLPLDMLKTNPLPEVLIRKLKMEAGVLGLASQLVDYEPEFAKAIEYLLGRVLIVQDMNTGIRLFKKDNLPLRIVTLEGEIINTSGAMTGGISKISNQYSPLKRKNEEKRLNQLNQETRNKLQTSMNYKTELQAELTKLDTSINQTKQVVAEKKFKYDLILEQMDLVTNEIEASVTQRDELLINVEKMGQEIIALDKIIVQEQENLTELQAASDKVSKELERLRNEIEQKRRDYEVGQERLSSYQDYISTKNKELISIKHSVEQFVQVKNSYAESLQEAKQTITSLNHEVEQEQLHIEELKKVSREQITLANNIKIAISQKQNEEKLQIDDLDKVKSMLKPLKDRLTEIETTMHRNEIVLTRLETELAGLEQKWRDAFHTELPDNIETSLNTSEVRQLKNNLTWLQNEINEIGPVDIGAIEEYEELTNRVVFLTAQFEDLTKAKESLETLLAETEKIMVKNFSQFFLLASESFKKTFAEIFGGGEAFLTLDDAEERLEAGVNIQVKMPGKKLQSLTLLSGGERALTCIAFIFGLLRLRPAPFCLLDEIDAALDEANLARFTDFLKRMAADIQFIIITHRQATIECGQNIYGITMPQEGISAVLTLNLDEAEGLAG